MIQSYPILGPCAWMGFSVPRNHREELKVLHATLLDCWDKGIKLVLLFFALWHIHIHMISHGLQCTPYMNGIMILSPSSGLPCLSSNASHFFVTTVTQPSLTQWFDSLTFRNTFFPWIFCEHCVNTHPFSCRGSDDLLSCTFGDGWIFSQRTCRIEG